jgi:O-antigen/teichoic acid export membrane protein
MASLFLFLLGFAATKRLWVGISGIVIARLVVTSIYDRHLCRDLIAQGTININDSMRDVGRRKHLFGLLRIGAPLGGVALLGTLFTSIPRLVLERYVSLEAVGYYAALASLLVVLNLFVTSFGQSITPRLARLYSERRGEFLQKYTAFFLVCMVFVGLCLVLSYYYSAPLLTVLFSSAYATYSSTFFKLMIAGALLAAFSLMNIAITAQRAFAVQLPIYLACSAVILVSCILLVPRYGIDGAAYAYAMCNLVGFLLCVGVFVHNIRTEAPVVVR